MHHCHRFFHPTAAAALRAFKVGRVPVGAMYLGVHWVVNRSLQHPPHALSMVTRFRNVSFAVVMAQCTWNDPPVVPLPWWHRPSCADCLSIPHTRRCQCQFSGCSFTDRQCLGTYSAAEPASTTTRTTSVITIESGSDDEFTSSLPLWQNDNNNSKRKQSVEQPSRPCRAWRFRKHITTRKRNEDDYEMTTDPEGLDLPPTGYHLWAAGNCTALELAECKLKRRHQLAKYTHQLAKEKFEHSFHALQDKSNRSRGSLLPVISDQE